MVWTYPWRVIPAHLSGYFSRLAALCTTTKQTGDAFFRIRRRQAFLRFTSLPKQFCGCRAGIRAEKKTSSPGAATNKKLAWRAASPRTAQRPATCKHATCKHVVAPCNTLLQQERLVAMPSPSCLGMPGWRRLRLSKPHLGSGRWVESESEMFEAQPVPRAPG